MKLFKRRKEDKGASNTVSFILIIGFVMTLIVSFIDVGIYFNVKNELHTAAENGARNVAIYGATDGDLRSHRSNNGQRVITAEEVVRTSITSKFNPEGAKKAVVEMGSDAIKCYPDKNGAGTTLGRAPKAGDPVWCEVKYKYNGIAGNFSLFNIASGGQKTIKGYAVSEVNIR